MHKAISPIYLAVDIVLFNIIDDKLHILLVKRKTEPYLGLLCLPGWFVLEKDTTEQTVTNVLYRETWVFCDHIKLFWSFSLLNRDPRGRIISLGYYSIISNNNINTVAGKNQESANFFPLREIWQLAFDHNDILNAAYFQLKQDIEKSDIVKYFLPKFFTIDQLKKSCEIIYDRKFEKRNFIKYTRSHFKITKTTKKEQYVNHRPAFFYKFTDL